MSIKSPTRAQVHVRNEHIEASAFLYEIVDTADRLRVARDFDGSPALRFDAQWRLLKAIEKCGGWPTFSDIARMLRTTRQSARALALAAERASVVELFPDSHDRRVIQVALTPSGRSILQRHRLPALPWLLTLLQGLEPATMRSTVHVLRVIRRRLESHERATKRAMSHDRALF